MNTKKLSRRRFFKITSMGLAGACLSLRGMDALAQRMGGGGGGMGGGGGGIDPPLGALFANPQLMPLTREGNLVTVNLEAQISPVNVNGTVANLMTYGYRDENLNFHGFFPGPPSL